MFDKIDRCTTIDELNELKKLVKQLYNNYHQEDCCGTLDCVRKETNMLREQLMLTQIDIKENKLILLEIKDLIVDYCILN